MNFREFVFRYPEYLSIISKVYQHVTRLTGTLHAVLCSIMVKRCSALLRLEMLLVQNVFYEIRDVDKIMY